MRLIPKDCEISRSIHSLRVGFFLLPHQDDPRPLLAAATVYVQPSFLEGIPNAVIEAMTDGVPCVTTDAGGLPEVMNHDVNGLLVPKGDPDRLAEALHRTLDSPDLRKQFVSNARRDAAAFSIEARAEEFETILSSPDKPFLSSRKPTRAVARRGIRNKTRRILVTQSEGFGDQIQSFPFLVALRRAFPAAEITVLVPRERRRLYKHLRLDHIFGIESESSSAFIRRQTYDFGFDLNLDPDQNPLVDLSISSLISFPKKTVGESQQCNDLFLGVPLWS